MYRVARVVSNLFLGWVMDGQRGAKGQRLKDGVLAAAAAVPGLLLRDWAS